jgi:predicted Zn finger-like uncharacterized protein
MIVRCSHCQNSFYVSPEKAGQAVPCTRCDQPINPVEDCKPAETKQAAVCKPMPANNFGADFFNYAINLPEGFRRLTLVISCLLGPVVYGVIKAKDYYTINARFSEPVDKSLHFLILWALCFTSVWIAYAGSIMVTRAFGIGQSRRNRKSILKPLFVVCLLSFLALTPGVIDTVGYVSGKETWYWEDVWGFFLPWSLAGFLFVWSGFLLTIYIGNGFRKTYLHQRLEHIEQMESFKNAPAMRPAGTGWRS